MDWFNELSRKYCMYRQNPGEEIKWTTPLKFPVTQPYYIFKETEVDTPLQLVTLRDFDGLEQTANDR